MSKWIMPIIIGLKKTIIVTNRDYNSPIKKSSLFIDDRLEAGSYKRQADTLSKIQSEEVY
jgi:hypothetical protein